MEWFVLKAINDNNTIISCGEMAYSGKGLFLRQISEHCKITINSWGEIAYNDSMWISKIDKVSIIQ